MYFIVKVDDHYVWLKCKLENMQDSLCRKFLVMVMPEVSSCVIVILRNFEFQLLDSIQNDQINSWSRDLFHCKS